ncbi:MAG: universal stress protein [Bradymonadaceae bacterium]
MSESDGESETVPSRVLVVVELPIEGEFAPALAETLAQSRPFILAIRSVPEQTAPEQAREEFEGESRAAMEEVVEVFERDGTSVDSELVFTGDVDQTVDRYRDEFAADAVLYARPTDDIDRVLAVGTADIDFDRFIRCLTSLGRTPLSTLKLLQLGDDEQAVDEQDLLLEGIESRLADRGVADEIVVTESIVPARETAEVLEIAEGYDMMVVAARRPTIGDRIMGSLADSVLDQTDLPVLLVRAPAE